MKKAILPILFLLLAGTQTKAQDFPQSNLISSNGAEPEVNGNGNKMSVDPYTGTAIVDFSLFQYADNFGLKHGLTLSYDGGGNKVDDIASSVGLNWNLTTGGQITREIKGLPDEDDLGWANLPANPTSFAATDTTLMFQYVRDSLDGQFDVYSFYAGGVHGKFIIGKNGDILCIPRMNIKIQKTAPVPSMTECWSYKFKITLENGTVYYFNKFDCANIYYVGHTGTTASTEWFLTKIVAPFGQDSITFDYDNIDHDYRGGYSLGCIAYSNYYIDTDPFAPNDFCSSVGISDYVIKTKRLSSIHYPDGTTLSLKYATQPRIDLYTSNGLDQIEIEKNSLKRGFNFYHSYMVRDTAFNNGLTVAYSYSTNLRPELNYSLQLDHFNEYVGVDTLPGHYFRYNSQNLPPRLCAFAVDWWGYYNGVLTKNSYFENGRTLYFPTETRIPAIYRNNAVEHEGGRRMASLLFSKAKCLEEITLPTGGKIKYDYELHHSDTWATTNLYDIQSYPEIGGLRVRQMIFTDGTGQNNDRKITYEYLKNDEISSSGVFVNSPIMHFQYGERYDSLFSMNGTLRSPLSCSRNQMRYGQFYPTNLIGRVGSPLNYQVKTHGRNVGYARVSVYDGTTTNWIGRTVYEFSTAIDYPIPVNCLQNGMPFPYIPDMDFAWGLTKVVHKTNRNFTLSKTINRFDVIINECNNVNFSSLKVAMKHYPAMTVNDGFARANSYPITGKVFLTNTTNIGYFYASQNKQTDAVYTYDTLRNVLLTSQTGNGNNEVIETRYYYPFHFSIGTGAIVLLNGANIITTPVRTEKWNLTKNLLLDVDVADLQILNACVRPLKTYDFIVDQPVTAAMWGAFNPNNLLQAFQYLRERIAFNSYDIKGNLTQATVLGKTNTTLYGYDNLYPVATTTNAAASDIAYTSFETNEYGGWTCSNPAALAIDTPGITGQSAAILNSSVYFYKNNLNAAKTYYLTFWSKSVALVHTSASSSGSNPQVITPTAGDTYRGWTLYRAKITNAQYVRLVGFGIIPVDELRLYPEGAMMNTTTYTQWKGKTSECDAANRISYQEYDQFGRVQYVKDMDGNIVKAYDYSIQQPQY